MRRLTTVLLLAAGILSASAQKMWINGRWIDLSDPQQTADATPAYTPARAAAHKVTVTPIDSIYAAAASRDVTYDTFDAMAYAPAIYDSYDPRLMAAGSDSIILPQYTFTPQRAPLHTDTTLSRIIAAINRRRRTQMNYMLLNPGSVRYNSSFFDSTARIYETTFDPTTARVQIKDVTDSLIAAVDATIAPPPIRRRNWLHNFDGAIQFTQAYNSPNWYQGGNSNLNMLVNAIYSINLNTKFHPNLLFENTLQYKLALTSAPEDELRNYSINEDLLQFNTKFGVRAAKRWFYSLSAQLKTQTLHNYISNTDQMKAAFMSPGELNVGLGMTYNYANPKGTYTFDLTMAPASYNLKTCLERRVDGSAFGIKPGHRTDNQFGANLEAKLSWKIAYNITLNSRLYTFTDYSYVQGDWENTLSFSINRFLSTQVYVHLRYDSQTPRLEDSRWHKWQLKEIFSFGFAYKFSNI